MSSFTVLLAGIILTNIADVCTAVREMRVGAKFDLTASVTMPPDNINRLCGIESGGRATTVHVVKESDTKLTAGDLVRISGSIHGYRFMRGAIPAARSLTVLSHGSPVSPVEATVQELKDHRFKDQVIRIEGTVQDVFRDEIDPGWLFLVIDDGDAPVYAALPSSESAFENFSRLVGARVGLTGLYADGSNGLRQMMGSILYLPGSSAVTVVVPPPQDPYDVPSIDNLERCNPSALNRLGRCRSAGRVIAVWRKNHLLVRKIDGGLCRIKCATPKLPAYGDFIEAVGFPETDLYRINLSRAVWRRLPAAAMKADEEKRISPRDIVMSENGRPLINIGYHGNAVRLCGTVTAVPRESAPDILHLNCDGHIVSVNIAAAQELTESLDVGCQAEIAGICIIDTDDWQPHSPFPQANDFILVVRSRKDISILSRPPFWTSGRLSAVIGALLAVLTGFLVWNRLLNRLVERRSRELLKEKSARSNADLKIEERTRLAAELHDTLAQDLTGVALQVDAALLAAERDPMACIPYLKKIEAKMRSCRAGLRDCLGDLRSRAFDEKNLAVSLRTALAAHIDTQNIRIDGNIPTHQLSANTLHNAICIVRELVINAIRHGKAEGIDITCALNKARLSIEVKDNGVGFDPESRPGPDNGHYGLLGIEERVHRLGGMVHIESTIGAGTRVRIENLDSDI